MAGSEEIRLRFPDGSVRTFPRGVTGLDVAKNISPRLAKEALGIVVDDEIWDLTRPIEKDAAVRIVTWNDPEGKYVFWHSSAHLMAEALQSLYPDVKFAIGPPIEQGFYYDVDLEDGKITEEDLPRIEARMTELARRKAPYQRQTVSRDEALRYYRDRGNPYKVEIIEELPPEAEITFYTQGDFTDLCRGPHLPHTGYIKAPKLLNVAGAYWRGDEKNKQLTRIYGITFPRRKMLDEYLQWREEVKKRDHRVLGKRLKIFTFSQEVGAGLPLWLPNGVALRNALTEMLQKEQRLRGYRPVVTPHIARTELYKISGHYDKYKESSFQPIKTPHEKEEYLLKPMNCPHHCIIYKEEPRSYRDLPLRLAEFGTVYRYEQSGELHGLTRVRSFTQDDAHIFCRPDQVKSEIKGVLEMTLNALRRLGLKDFYVQVSLRDPANPEKYIGAPERWEQAEQALREVVKEVGLEAREEEGEAAFYGPKLDFMVRDALGRAWQLGTVQLDYNLPERFDLVYTDEQSQPQRPVMIHRAPMGSLERIVAILLEHTGGNFPLWLAPVQVIVLPVSDKHLEYARQVGRRLFTEGFRAEVDERSETIGKKIRDAEHRKIPYMLIVGGKEAAEGTVSIRRHQHGDQGVIALEAFIPILHDQIHNETA